MPLHTVGMQQEDLFFGPLGHLNWGGKDGECENEQRKEYFHISGHFLSDLQRFEMSFLQDAHLFFEPIPFIGSWQLMLYQKEGASPRVGWARSFKTPAFNSIASFSMDAPAKDN